MSTISKNEKLQSYGSLLLRLSLGGALIAHGLYKLLVLTLPATAEFYGSAGFPGWLAYPVVGSELIGGLALVIGFYTRWAVLAVLPALSLSLWIHSGNGWLFASAGGGWEFPLLLSVIAIVQFLLGDGAYALRNLSKLSLRRSSSSTPPVAA